MRGKKSKASSDVREQVSTLAQTIIEQASHRAVFGADRAREAASTAKGRIPNMHRGMDEVSPNLRDVALQAASAAVELWQATRQRAESAVETAEHAIAEPVAGVVDMVERHARNAASQVAGRADDVSELAKQTASQVAGRAEDVTGRAKAAASSMSGLADATSERAKSATAQAFHLADDASVRVKEVTKSAAESTVTTSKDTGATLLWTAAAAGLVFYALLDKDRREQVLKVVDGVVLQAREIIRDFQGYDEEFS